MSLEQMKQLSSGRPKRTVLLTVISLALHENNFVNFGPLTKKLFGHMFTYHVYVDSGLKFSVWPLISLGKRA